MIHTAYKLLNLETYLWTINVNSGGTLSCKDREYAYVFWEATDMINPRINLNNAHCVDRSNAVNYINDILIKCTGKTRFTIILGCIIYRKICYI